jgi:hypothetical protein
MQIDISTYLPCTPEVAIEHVKSPALLLHIARPLLDFRAYDPPQLPAVWADGTYWVSMRLFGILPLGRQAVVISQPPADVFTVRDNGYSALIQKWDHVITIAPSGSGTLYRDRVTIQAGVFTPIVSLFAQYFYRHRQRRWRQLASGGFHYHTP